MNNQYNNIAISDGLLSDMEISRVEEGDDKGRELLAGAVNSWFEGFDTPGKGHTLIAGVENDRFLVAIVDKEQMEDIWDNDEGWVNGQDTLKDNAKALLSFSAEETWSYDDEQYDVQQPARHSAQIEPEFEQVGVRTNTMTVKLDEPEVIMKAPQDLKKVENAIKSLAGLDFEVGHYEEKGGIDEDFHFDDHIATQINRVFSKAALGVEEKENTQNELEMTM